MDKKLRSLQRLSNSDPVSKERYIRELERLVGLSEPAEEGRLKCLVNNCPNQADQGYGLYLLTQSNIPGQIPYTWDKAVGPLFICGPCYRHLKEAPWRQ